MEWLIGGIVIYFVVKKITKKTQGYELDDSMQSQSKGPFIDLEKMLKNNRIKALKKESDLIDKRIAMEKELISTMEQLTKKGEKTAVEHIAQAKARADILSLKILKSTGKKKKGLEFKRSQEIKNQKYWIRQILA